MIYKRCTDPKVFGFGVLVPKKDYRKILKYKKEIKPHVDWVVKTQNYPKSNSMVPHLSIKYLGYHENYSNEEIMEIAKDIKKISKRYLPIKMKFHGIKIGTKRDNLGVLLNSKFPTSVKEFHNEVISKLRNKIDIFKDIDGRNFEPHITIASGKKNKENMKALRLVKKKSKKDKVTKIELKDMYIYLKKKGPIILK